MHPASPAGSTLWRDDVDARRGFYTELFGWEAARDEYSMFQLRGRDVAGIGAPRGAAGGVDDVRVGGRRGRDRRCGDRGGRHADHEPFDSLDGGRIAIAADPAGAAFGIWQLGEHRGAELVNEPGAWAMSALSTPDPEGANAFYGAVFGWETEAFGPATLYRLPGYVGGEPTQPVSREVIAVMMPGEHAAWMPDFWVHDADAAAATVARLGGTVIAPPADDGIGRSGVVADPTGAVFSISKVL